MQSRSGLRFLSVSHFNARIAQLKSRVQQFGDGKLFSVQLDFDVEEFRISAFMRERDCDRIATFPETLGFAPFNLLEITLVDIY